MKLMSSGRRLVGLGHKPSKLAIPGSNPGDRTKRNTHFLIEASSQFQNQVVCRGQGQWRRRGWKIGEKLLPITPFAHYGSFSALFGGTLSNLIIMAFNLDSLSRLLWHLNRSIGSPFFRKALRIKNHY